MHKIWENWPEALRVGAPGDKIVINSHWEPSLPNAPGKDKIWEEASPEAKRSGS